MLTKCRWLLLAATQCDFDVPVLSFLCFCSASEHWPQIGTQALAASAIAITTRSESSGGNPIRKALLFLLSESL